MIRPCCGVAKYRLPVALLAVVVACSAAAFIGIVWSARELRAQSTQSSTTTGLLEALVGDWRMVGQVRGQPVTYDVVARRILNGRFVELHMKDVARPPQYEALVFIGEDTLANGVLVHWLDSFGAAYSVPHGKGAISGDTVQFEIPYRDRPFRDTFVFRRLDRSWIFRLEVSDGRGGWKLFAEYTVRQLVAPARLPETGAARAPDGHVAFIRATPDRLVSTSLGEEQATELWIAKADGTDARRLLTGSAADSVEHTLASMSSPHFSPDGRRVYFLSRAWVTSDAVHAVDIATGREWFVAPGNSLAIVPRGPLAGCLLVGQHRHWPNGGGSYDWTWLLASDGRTISLAASDSDGADRRISMWMNGNVPDSALQGSHTASSNMRCNGQESH